MRTIETKLYKYSELSDTAKQAVKDGWEFDDFWGDDRVRSGRAAKEIYQRISSSELDGLRLYKWIVNNILPELTSVRKYYKRVLDGQPGKYYTKYRKQNDHEKCVRFSRIFNRIDADNLTGYCADYAFLEPLFDFLKNPIGDLSSVDVDYICTQEYNSDYEWFYEEANFADHMEANAYEFTEDGKMY
jgi:hypothetical protein